MIAQGTEAAIWLPIDQVAAGARLTRRAIEKQLARRVIDGRLVDGRREVLLSSLPTEVQERYLASPARTLSNAEIAQAHPELVDLHRRVGRFPPEERIAIEREAARRADILRRFDDLEPKRCRDARGNAVPTQALLSLCAEWAATDPRVLLRFPSWGEPCNWRTLYNGLRAMQNGGAVKLVRARGDIRHDDPRRRPIKPDIQAAILRLRLLEYRNATVESIYRHLLDEFPGRDDLPSLRTVRRFIDIAIPKGVDIYNRQGPRTFDGTIATPILRSYDDIDVGEWWSGDHHELDFPVINPARGGQLDRPWLTSWVDVKSRSPIGWHLSFNPNARTVVNAFIHAVQPKKDPAFAHLSGLPRFCYIDNGKDYRSHVLEGERGDDCGVVGTFKMFGVEVVHAAPYNAKAKIVERWHRTLRTEFSQDQPTYCGSHPKERTERHRELVEQHQRWLEKKDPNERSPFMTMDELKVAFAEYVVRYLRSPHQRLKERATGRELAPADVAQGRKLPARLPDEKSLAYAAWPVFMRTVQKGTIEIGGYNYRHEALLNHQGKRLECRRDPDEVGRILVHQPWPKAELVCWATNVTLLTYGADEATLAEAKKLQKRERKAAEQHLEVEHRRLTGRSALDVVTERRGQKKPEPPTSASPGVQTEGAVRQLAPVALEKLARAATAAGAAPVETPAPIVDDEAWVIAAIGPRPELPEYEFNDFDTRISKNAQLDWDAERERLLSRRHSTPQTPGGPA